MPNQDGPSSENVAKVTHHWRIMYYDLKTPMNKNSLPKKKKTKEASAIN